MCVYTYIHTYIHNTYIQGDAVRLRMPVIYWSSLSHFHTTTNFTYIHRPQTPKPYQMINKDKI